MTNGIFPIVKFLLENRRISAIPLESFRDKQKNPILSKTHSIRNNWSNYRPADHNLTKRSRNL